MCPRAKERHRGMFALMRGGGRKRQGERRVQRLSADAPPGWTFLRKRRANGMGGGYAFHAVGDEPRGGLSHHGRHRAAGAAAAPPAQGTVFLVVDARAFAPAAAGVPRLAPERVRTLGAGVESAEPELYMDLLESMSNERNAASSRSSWDLLFILNFGILRNYRCWWIHSLT